MAKLKKILKSKAVVFLAIFAFWGIGSYKMTASADYSFGAVYQYYLLDNRGGEITSEAENETIMSMGNLGSGNVSGSFSYDDMINSASDDTKDKTKQFVSMMATYSTFNYFDNKIQGFELLITLVSRFLVSIILFPLAILSDILNSIVPALIGGIAKLNVITLIGSAVGNASGTSALAEALNISKETIQTFVNIGLSSAIMLILLAVFGTLKKGSSKIDQRYASKLKGRIASLILLPIMVTAGAYIISTLHDAVTDNSPTASSFSRYMIDVRSWAYNFNFAPKGDNSDASDIRPTTKSSYVDLSLNPYTNTGKERIEAINSKSSLAGDIKEPMKNTTLMIAYAGLQSFSSVDFINYKGSPASLNYYGRSDGNGETFGSYHNYAKSLGDSLVDVDKSITGTGKGLSIEKANGSFKSAIRDYKNGDSMTVTPEIAWRDRFIYGAKSGGDGLDDYYNSKPSQEMIITEVGTNGGYALTNQSMFLALSTIFGETGGRYSIEAPARGVMAMKGMFDSNRSDYFVVSMVGSPIFTLFGMVAEPIIQVVVLLALVMAIISIGIIQMNLLPLTAWLKGIFIGDWEYPQAFVIYSIGIAGTMFSMSTLPAILTLIIFAMAKLIVLPTQAFTEINTPQASLAYEGTPLIITAGIAIVFAIMFFKDARFRMLLISTFTFVWDWAVSMGQKLENTASQGMGSRIKSARRSNERRLQSFEKGAGEWFKTGNGKDESDDPDKPDKPDLPDDNGGGNEEDSQSVDELRKNAESKKEKVIDDFNQGMLEKQNDDETSPISKTQAVEVEQALDDVKDDPTEKNIDKAKEKLATYKETLESEGDATPEELEKVDNMNEELESMKNIETEKSEQEKINKEKELNEQEKSNESKDVKKDLSDMTIEEIVNSEQTNTLKDLQEKENQGKELTEQEIKQKEILENELHGKQTTVDELRTMTETGTFDEGSNVDVSGIGRNASSVLQSKIQEENVRVNVDGVVDTRLVGDNMDIPSEGIKNTQTETIKNSTHEYTANRENYVHRQTKELSEGLGKAMENKNVANAVNKISDSQDVEEMRKSLQFMRSSFSVLDEKERKDINQEKVSKTIENMLKYISNNEK